MTDNLPTIQPYIYTVSATQITNSVVVSSPGPQGVTGPAGVVNYSEIPVIYPIKNNSGSIAFDTSYRTNYGTFYATGSATAPVASSSYPIVLGNTLYSNSITNNSSSIIFASGGLYNIQYSGQCINKDNFNQDIDIWIKVNGNNLNYSARTTTVPSAKNANTPGKSVINGSVTASINAGQAIQFLWSSTNVLAYLDTSASSQHPVGPMFYVTVTQHA